MGTHSEPEGAPRAGESPVIEPVAVNAENLEALLSSEVWSVKAPVETTLSRLAANVNAAGSAERPRTRIPRTALAAGLVWVLAGVCAFMVRDRLLLALRQSAPSTAVGVPLPVEAEPTPVAVSAPAPPQVRRTPARSATIRSFMPPLSRRIPDAPRAVLPDAPPAAPSVPIPAAVTGVPAALARIPPPPAPVKQIRVGGRIQAARLIKKVTPVYPPIARQARVQGTVRLTATIGKNGTIQNLQLLGGPELLVAPATDAVKQWTYRPTLLNGDPVEVVTQIEVVFTLRQ